MTMTQLQLGVVYSNMKSYCQILSSIYQQALCLNHCNKTMLTIITARSKIRTPITTYSKSIFMNCYLLRTFDGSLEGVVWVDGLQEGVSLVQELLEGVS